MSYVGEPLELNPKVRTNNFISQASNININMFRSFEVYMLVGTLFQWSRIWGFTQRISISDFLQSVSFSS